jgi:hypothetical protein
MIESDFYGDKFRWFVGVVKDVGDDRSRVRVRIFGIHHTEDLVRVSDGDLPWAMVMYPTTGGQTSGGSVSHGLRNGSWVVGFFVDGEDSQQPIVIGAINGGFGSTNNSPPEGPNYNTNSNFYGSSTPTNDPNASIDTPSTQLTGNDNTIKAYNYFWEKISSENNFTGDKKCIVAAIVGNLMVESGDSLNPQAYNPNDLGQSSYGIAQWRSGKYDRATPFFRFCGCTANVTPPNLPTLDRQLDFVWHEFHTTERAAYSKLLTSSTIQDAIQGMISYERDESYKNGRVDTTNRTYLRKLAKARQVLSSYSYSGNSV